jgi:hypothetical protein
MKSSCNIHWSFELNHLLPKLSSDNQSEDDKIDQEAIRSIEFGS